MVLHLCYGLDADQSVVVVIRYCEWRCVKCTALQYIIKVEFSVLEKSKSDVTRNREWKVQSDDASNYV
jgi:hypothetical protein